MTIRVIVNGAQGKMGRITVSAVEAAPDLTLVGATGRQDQLANAIHSLNADVVVDFTLPDAVYNNTKTIIEAGARPVIGATGLRADQIDTLSKQCAQIGRGGIIAPNFSIAAILMMNAAATAAAYLKHAEIIEMHHDRKLDSPSGTAIKTAQLMATNRTTPTTQHHTDSTERSHNNSTHTADGQATQTDHPARGVCYSGIPIHSIRLPGLFAHQSVIFSQPGESLIMTHDCRNREAMMPGVLFCCRKVMTLDRLVYGMETLLDATK